MSVAFAGKLMSKYEHWLVPFSNRKFEACTRKCFHAFSGVAITAEYRPRSPSIPPPTHLHTNWSTPWHSTVYSLYSSTLSSTLNSLNTEHELRCTQHCEVGPSRWIYNDLMLLLDVKMSTTKELDYYRRWIGRSPETKSIINCAVAVHLVLHIALNFGRFIAI